MAGRPAALSIHIHRRRSRVGWPLRTPLNHTIHRGGDESAVIARSSAGDELGWGQMLDPHRELQALIDGFVDRLTEIAKRIALEQVRQAFGSVKLPPVRSSSVSSPASSPAKSAPASSSASSPSASSSSGAARRGRGRGRRGPQEIELLRDKLLAVISDNPGCRAEDINRALGTRTPQIAQPLRRLVADRLVRTEGARRGTRYFAVAAAAEAQNGRRPPAEVVAGGGDEPALAAGHAG